MKLHLPKQLFTALLAAITLATPATLTLGSAAWGEEESGSSTDTSTTVDYSVFDGYSYDIYQWTGTDGIVSKGLWYKMTYDEGSMTLVRAKDADSGEDISAGVSGDTNGYKDYIASNKVLAFDGYSTTVSESEALVYKWDCDPMKFSGIVVKKDAQGTCLYASNADEDGRNIEIGDDSSTATTSHSIIEKDFTINTRNSNITLKGTQVWQVADGATYTLNAGASKSILLTGDLTLQSGTVTFASELQLKDASNLLVQNGSVVTATTITSSGSENTNRKVSIEQGASVTTGEFKVAYNLGSVDVDGELEVTTELYLGSNNRYNVTSLLTGDGSVTATKFRAGNWGSYGVNVATLSIGASGLVVENGAVLNLASTTTTVTGTTTVNSGNELNFNAGTATLTGAVTNNGNVNVNGGSVTLNGGMSGTGALSIAEGAALTVATGTVLDIQHTIGGTGQLNLNGTLNVTDYTGLDSFTYIYQDDGTSGFRTGFSGSLFGGTISNTSNITVEGLADDAFSVENGILKGTLAGNGVYYVEESLTYSDTTMGSAAGATSIEVSSTGALSINYAPEEENTALCTVPITNKGNVSIAAADNDVALNNIFNAATGITQDSTGTTSITGSGTTSLPTSLTANGVLSIIGTSAESKATFSASAGLKIGTLILENTTATISGGEKALGSNITLNSGATLTVYCSDSDLVDYGGTQYTWTVNEGATLWVGSATAASRQTLARNFSLILAGGVVNGKTDSYGALDYYNNNETGNASTAGTIQVTKSSILNAAVRARTGKVIFQVDGTDTVLTMGNPDASITNYAALTGGGIFEKTGTGTLLYRGAAFDQDLTISNGVFDYEVGAERTHSASISGSGTFRKSGSGTLTLTNASAVNLNVAGGKLVYNSSTETTHTLSSNAGTTFEKTGSSTLTADINNLKGELLISAGTLKLNAKATDTTSNSQVPWRSVTVGKDAVFDINGKPAYNNLTLESGSTLSNSTANTDPGSGERQLPTITLTGAATMNANGHIRMLGSGHDVTALYLGGHTLTKTGTGTFFMQNTHVKTGGTIQINAGLVKAYTHNSKTQDLNGLNLHLNGGNFELAGSSQNIQALTLTSGTLTIGSGLTLTTLGDVIMDGSKTEDTSTGTVTYTSTVSGNLCLSGTITLNGSVNMSGATLSGTSLAGFTLQESTKPATSGLQSLTYQIWSGDGSINTTQSTISVGGVNYEMNAATGTFTTAGTVYYVATDDTITVGGSSATTGVEAASAFHVASGAKLDIAELPTGWTAAELLAGKVTGAGTLLVSQSGLATGSANLTTTFGGTLELAKGVTFTLGRGDDYSQGLAINTSSLASVVLNAGATAEEGSKLEYNASGVTTMKNLTVKAVSESEKGTATLHYKDSDVANAVTLAGTTQLNGNLNVTTVYDGGLDVEHLSGAGAFSVTGSSNSGNFNVTIQSLQGYSGSLSFSDAELSAHVSTGTSAPITMGSITATGVHEFTFNVDTNTSLDSLTATNGTVNLAAGTTLTLGQTGEGAQATTSSLGTVVASSGGNTIHLNETATLNKITKGGGSGAITLTGSGVYDLGEVSGLGDANNSIVNVVGVTTNSLKDTANWTGTVRLHGTTSGAMLHNLGNSNSWVEVAEEGLRGYLHTNNAGDVTPNIRLTGDLELTENSGYSSYKFTGDYAGAGAFKVSYANGTERSFEFAGNIAEWTGAFTQTATATGTTSNVKFTGEAKDINTEISNTAGTLNLEINTTDNATLSKNVSVSKVQVNNTVTLTGESNSITAGNVTISQKNASLSNVTVQSGSIAATSTADGAKGSISGALVEMQSATSFSISDMVLSNVKLSAVEGASVALTNVSATNTLLAGGGDFTLNATPTVEAAANDTTTGRISYTCGLGVESGSSLTLNLDVINAVRPDQHGTYDLSITLSGFGSDFRITSEEAILGMVKFDASSWLAQALEEQGAEWRAEITEATENTVVAQSSVPMVTYSAGTGENVGMLVITINGLNVPEPATSTLSLLALAALAARRRRK
ncbi:MAG: hypothetical protein IJE88_05870 [Akkermansia sp.]|nr:hypothetical protein [Akkermansia sp.]